ncbi:Uncharacterised protein [Bordetella pertussis]|nr:Uncharacterised protein [Bordetella pertussis]
MFVQVALALAAGEAWTALAGWVAPWLAAITMLLSSLAVAGNAWRLRRHRWDAAPAAAVAQPAP